jgi:hypothetical protein
MYFFQSPKEEEKDRGRGRGRGRGREREEGSKGRKWEEKMKV